MRSHFSRIFEEIGFMIRLAELLHTIHNDKEDGLVPVDDWKMTDAEYLFDVGFELAGSNFVALKRPRLMISFKKGEGFILKDEVKKEKPGAS